MARTASDNHEKLTFQANGTERIELPSVDFIADAKMVRDGHDLILEAPNGEVAVIEGYFSADPAPLLQSPDGATLTPNLVQAFARSPYEFAANETASDESPVGAVEEVKGNATVTRADGTVETITNGTPIYQGDIVQTDANGAVNIVFIDETSMAVSENARLAIDEYTYDPSTESGTTNFSVLRGLFVFTSGLIGRDDPDDVKIDTPVGSIGIRGTIIAGEIQPGGESNISVLEGAIVITNATGETTLSQQFETVRLNSFNEPIREMGVMNASDVGARFSSVSGVNPSLFSMINDAAQEQSGAPAQQAPAQTAPSDQNSQNDAAPQPDAQQQAEAPAPEPIVAPMPADIVNLNNNGMGLPDANAVAGQPSAGMLGPNGAAGNMPPPPPGGMAGLPPPPNGMAPGMPGPGNLMMPPPNSTDAPPPPSVINPPPPSPVPAVTGGTFNDITPSGQVVGSINSGIAGTTYTFAAANTYFQLVANGTGVNVVLTTAGHMALAASLDVVDLGNFNVVTTYPDGRIATVTFDVNVTDASAGRTLDLDGPAAGVSRITDNIGNSIGYSITALGDVDNDGFDDFAFTNAVDNENHIYKVYGGPANLPSSADILSLDTANRLEVVVNPATVVVTTGISFGATGFAGLPGMDTTNLEVFIDGTLVPSASYSYNFSTGSVTFSGGYTSPSSGTAYLKGVVDTSETVISGVGDFNGDGVEDYIIGQYLNNTGGAMSGNVAIVSGANPADRLYFGAAMPASAEIGYSVSGIGDFDNDGYADIIIGAPSLTGGNGGAYLALGGTPWGSTLSANVITVPGSASASFGTSVEGIGDFDGDGYSDFAVGGPTANSGNGEVKIYTGSQGGSATSTFTLTTGSPVGLGEDIMGLGDINGDGISDIMVGSDTNFGAIYFGGDATSDISLNIPDGATGYAVSGGGSAGDFNGDGYDDFTISLTNDTESRAYIVFGKGTLPGVINTDYLKNSANALELTYSDAVDFDELEITSVGDVNGDGYDDLAVGAPDAATGDGEVFVVYGRDTGNTTAGLSATANNQHLVGTQIADALNDGGFTNVSMRGGAGNDSFMIRNTNFLGIDGGTNAVGGYDRIISDQNLDFSAVNFEKMSGIEMLQYTGTTQTMTLTLENLFNLLKTSDTGSLKIDSSIAGNILNLDAAGAIPGATTTDITNALNQHGNGAVDNGPNAGYNEFTIGGYKLFIDVDLTVNIQ